MNERPTKRGGGAVAVMALVAVLVLLPLLYVLSIGPVAYLSERGLIEYRAGSPIVLFYVPLFWATRQSELFHDVLTWYIELW
jgi:hypothetical protein